MAERKDGSPQLGLQPDGSLVVDRKNDYAFEFLQTLDWSRPLRNTTSSAVWSDGKEWERSAAYKYMHYQSDDSFLDLDNPTNYGLIPDLRKMECRSQKSKKKKDAEVTEFSITKQSVHEVPSNKNLEVEEEQDKDDFLDEFGNVRVHEEKVAEEPEVEEEPPEKENPKQKPKNKKQVAKKKVGGCYRDWDNVQAGISSTKGDGASKTRGFQLEEPRASLLSLKEQKVYLQLYEKFKGNQSSQPTEEHSNLFQSYQEVVKEEQAEFQAFAREYFDCIQPKTPEEMAKTYLQPHVRHFITGYYSTHLTRASRLYPQWYSPLGHLDTSDSMLRMVPLSNEQQERPRFEMRCLKTVLEMGDIFKLNRPTFKAIVDAWNPVKVTSCYNKIAARFPTRTDDKLPISRDANAGKLSEVYLPDVVISTSSLKAIFNNFGALDKVWEIPFEVRVAGRKKVVFIDKPFSPKSLSAQAKNAWFLKKASSCLLLHPWTHSTPVASGTTQDIRNLNPEHQLVDYSDPFAEVDVDLSLLETFGGSNSETVSQVDGADDSDDSENELMIVGNEEDDVTPNGATRKSFERPPDADQKAAVENSTGALLQVEEGGRPISHAKSDAASYQNDFGAYKPREINETSEAVEKVLVSQGSLSPIKRNITVSSSADDDGAKDVDHQTPHKRKINKLDDILSKTAEEKRQQKRENASRRTGSARKGFLSSIITAQKTMFVRDDVVTDQNQALNEALLPFSEKASFADAGLDMKDFQAPPSNKNVAFRLWTLRPKVQSEASSWSRARGDLTVLTRSSTHGQVKIGRNFCERHTISCKPEYQSNFGCEIVSKSDLAKEWMSTLARPGSFLTRIRVDAEKHNVLNVEKKSLKELTKDGLAVDFKPDELLGNLHTLFSGLIAKLPETNARYLLFHDVKTGPFVKVMKANSVNGDCKSYDLHRAYRMANANEDLVSLQGPTPIDFSVITPGHKIRGRFPGLFQPRKYEDCKGKTSLKIKRRK